MKQRVIAIDAGHSTHDPGCVGPGNRHEADATLELALTCKEALQKAGGTVFLTRDDAQNGDVDLYERTVRARKAHAAGFVSLHYNSIGAGGLVYYSPTPGSQSLAKRLAANVGQQRLWRTAESRFGRLYIDDFAATGYPAVLWEVDGIEHAPPTRDAGRAARLKSAALLVKAVKWTRTMKGVLPSPSRAGWIEIPYPLPDLLPSPFGAGIETAARFTASNAARVTSARLGWRRIETPQ